MWIQVIFCIQVTCKLLVCASKIIKLNKILEDKIYIYFKHFLHLAESGAKITNNYNAIREYKLEFHWFHCVMKEVLIQHLL